MGKKFLKSNDQMFYIMLEEHTANFRPHVKQTDKRLANLCLV